MITIHEAKAADFTTLGLGALLPSECIVQERAGGMYELKIVHPVTDDARHQRIKPMRIIKAPAPMRETPLIEIGQTGTVAREIYKVATVGMRLNMRAGASMESKVIHAYKPGTEVCKLGVTGDWMQVIVLDGGASGWMWADNLEYVRTETEIVIGDTPGTVVQPRQTREQLFRIYRYSPDSKERAVTAEARHITYDLAGAVVDGEYSPENVAADQVCAQIMAKADHDVSDFHIYCTVSTPISGEFGGRNILDCLLDPETGIVAQAKARIVRDNYDIFIMPDEVRNRGVELRYGKNLLSAYMDTDTSDMITRIRPVGKTRDGEKLYIENNGGWVESPYINKYPVVYSKEVEYDVVESDELTINQARTLLQEKAEADFLAGCDMATVKLDAEFIRVELTEDYKHLANQYALHLYDSVPVIDREADIVATARMTEYVYDSLLDEYRDTGLGELEEVKSTIYGYELVAGTVSGGKLIPNTVNGDRLQNLSVSYGKFDLAAIGQLSADAIVAVRAEIRQLVAGEITTDRLYADIAVIAAAQITAANIEKANIQWAEIENLTAEIAKIANAEIGNAVIDTAQIQNLTAAVATIVKAEIAIAEIDWARIKNVQVDTAQIRLGAITQALIAQGAIGTAQIADGSITEAKIVSLNADVIKTGTLSAERLLIKGAGGLFYEINATAGGLTAAQLTEEQYKNAISGTALVAKSVTAEQIASKTITANEILGGTITAAEINVANLFAAEATIAALDSYIIRTTTIEALQNRLDVWASEKVRIGVDNLQIGGRNLLRFSKELPVGSTISEWGLSDAEKASTYDDAGSGFDRIMLKDSGQTEDTWVYARSPLMRLPGGWQGKQVTLSAYIWSSDWAGMDAGGQGPITWSVCLSKGTAERLNYGAKYNLIKPGLVELGADAKGDALANSKWVRIHTTFTLNEDELSGGSGVFGDNTHIFVQFFLRRNGEYRIYAPKLEIGNKATDWSPAPEDTEAALTIERDRISAEVKRATEAEGALSGRIETTAEGILLEVNKKANSGDPATGVNTGEESSVQVEITSKKFEIDVPGEDGDLTLNESGGRLPVLIGDDITAPNVAPRYDGAGGLYVDPNATSSQIAAGNYFRSLKDALATLDRKWVGKNIVINLAASMTEYGTLSLTGVSGGGWITIQGDSGSPAKLNGRLNLYFCPSPISVKYLNIDTPTTGINAEGCQAVSIADAVINGPGTAVSGSRGIRSAQGSMVTVTGCEIYECERSLYGDGAPIIARNCRGNCRVGAYMTTLYLAGTMPCDTAAWTAATWAGQVITQDVTVDMGSATVPSTEPVTATFDYLHSDSYARGWNAFADEDARQGYNGETIHGVIWFDAAQIGSALSGRTIHQASLRLHMQTGVGRGVNVSVQLYGSDVSYERTSAPGLTTSYGTIGSTVPGEINEITIPVQAIADLAAGTIQALVLKSDDTGYYNNRGYSKNYARFSGSTSAASSNCPRLTVVYQ